MLHHALPKSSLKISRIGLGTVQFGMDYGYTKKKTQKQVDEILSYCLDHDINFLDTARDYGDSEKKIGQFLKNIPRRNFIIATKISKINPEIQKNKKKVLECILRSVETSINELFLEKLDLLQLHQADRYILSNDFFWDAIVHLKEKKIFNKFGISVYEGDLTKNILNRYHRYIDFIQIPYNIFDQRFSRMFPFFKDKNISIISRSVFLKGIITASEETVPVELNRIKYFKRKLLNISMNAKLSVAELALLFVLSNRYINTTILGIGAIEELEANMAALKKNDLFEKVKTEINMLRIDDPYLIDPRKWWQL